MLPKVGLMNWFETLVGLNIFHNFWQWITKVQQLELNEHTWAMWFCRCAFICVVGKKTVCTGEEGEKCRSFLDFRKTLNFQHEKPGPFCTCLSLNILRFWHFFFFRWQMTRLRLQTPTSHPTWNRCWTSWPRRKRKGSLERQAPAWSISCTTRSWRRSTLWARQM